MRVYRGKGDFLKLCRRKETFILEEAQKAIVSQGQI